MNSDYDHLVRSHYREEACKHGLSATSTMADIITRQMETETIVTFVSTVCQMWQAAGHNRSKLIADVGCGNGYTLKVLLEQFPDQHFLGVENSPDLHALAERRFTEVGNIEIVEGDIRTTDFAGGRRLDIIICQRVLINLLSREDQRTALDNMIVSMPIGGRLLLIEGVHSSIQILNEARAEFDLSPIEPAHHNLYLEDDFFVRDDLMAHRAEGWSIPENFLSTHYFVSRVLHPLVQGDRPFNRNSQFVSFVSQALKPAVGDYSPLKLFAFQKCERR